MDAKYITKASGEPIHSWLTIYKGTQQIFVRVLNFCTGPRTPYPFIYHFFYEKGTPFVYLLLKRKKKRGTAFTYLV